MQGELHLCPFYAPRESVTAQLCCCAVTDLRTVATPQVLSSNRRAGSHPREPAIVAAIAVRTVNGGHCHCFCWPCGPGGGELSLHPSRRWTVGRHTYIACTDNLESTPLLQPPSRCDLGLGLLAPELGSWMWILSLDVEERYPASESPYAAQMPRERKKSPCEVSWSGVTRHPLLLRSRLAGPPRNQSGCRCRCMETGSTEWQLAQSRNAQCSLVGAARHTQCD